MNIRLTSLNLRHLPILNANFHFYQLNNCNCHSNITNFFVVASTLEKVNYFYLLSRQIGSPTNWLADKFVPSNCLSPNWSRQIVLVREKDIKYVPFHEKNFFHPWSTSKYKKWDNGSANNDVHLKRRFLL